MFGAFHAVVLAPRASLTAVVSAVGCSALAAPAAAADQPTSPSVCHGTTSQGSLENGVRLPRTGANFVPYSNIGVLLGRTWVHGRVAKIVVAAYEALAESRPDTVYMYGETGFREGGPFDPHKTHQNGLSLDHMVPVLDSTGRSLPLPTSPFNKLGYAIEFDEAGRWEDLAIDFEALSELLYELHRASLAEGVDIWRVIFDPKLQPFLHPTARWSYLAEHVEFSTKRSWVRHDEHIHVDFRVPCS